MTAPYNPQRAAELCASAATTRDASWFVDYGPELADQLRAAMTEIAAKQRGYDDLHAMLPGRGDIWSKVDNLCGSSAKLRTAVRWAVDEMRSRGWTQTADRLLNKAGMTSNPTNPAPGDK